MPTVNINYELMRQRCLDLTKDGKTLTIHWDGGNDSGSFGLELGGERLPHNHPADEMLLELAEKELDYGSFAGDFYATGRVDFDPEEMAFVGVDTYTDSDLSDQPVNIRLAVPRTFWFDTLVVAANQDEFDPLEASVQLIVNNGPKTKQHAELEALLTDHIAAAVRIAISGLDDFTGMSYQQEWGRDELAKEGEELALYIGQLPYSYDKDVDTDIFIDLKQDL